MRPPYSSLTIANTFLHMARESGVPVTPMQLQKLVYVAHGWHLAFYDQPLINHQVEAWKYGPVIPPLYYETRQYGAGAVTKDVSLSSYGLSSDSEYKIVPESDARTRGFLRQIWTLYGHFSGVQLSAMTHQSDTPWYETWHKKGGKDYLGTDIPESLIKDHFKRLREKRKRARVSESG